MENNDTILPAAHNYSYSRIVYNHTAPLAYNEYNFTAVMSYMFIDMPLRVLNPISKSGRGRQAIANLEE